MIRKKKPKIIIGWEEWCSFPELGLPAIKMKVDTGAKTSALHAYDIKKFTQDGMDFVRFKIHPIQKDNEFEKTCVAPLSDYRYVISSNGEREKRFVIKTELELSDKRILAELTLTSRHKMAFRMLLGREALRKAKLIVDPSKSYLLGKKTNVKELYSLT